MSDNISAIRHIEINVRPISNGFVGRVSVCHGDYDRTDTQETFFEHLEIAVANLSHIAIEPEKVIADFPASGDGPF